MQKSLAAQQSEVIDPKYDRFFAKMLVPKLAMSGVKLSKSTDGRLDVRLSYRLPFDIETSWQAMKDVKLLVEDKYHHNLQWMSEAHEGLGAEFEVLHSHFGLSETQGGKVRAKIIEWESNSPAERSIVLQEESENSIFDHNQSFLLKKEKSGTLFQYIGHLPQVTVDNYYEGLSHPRKWALTVQIAFEVNRLIDAKYLLLLKRCRQLSEMSRAQRE
jgi:hypothetical protein